ncbi:MAG: electron transfer flavoprotein subunit alpha/FixB family protein [Nitrososphaerota archaeon]|nr:electron transfer flavoprotein subunit alpha/FixB family protein [Candidatus Bathyarchaeota archaeon]MDW8049188.1 electron transfer flavoprotein subunit alpha/FixB family protein [Nitrososphaerota archaeon]
MGDILIYAEQEDGEIHPVTYELICKGRELAGKLGCKVDSVLLGSRIEEKASELVAYGADRIFIFDHSSLHDFDLIRYSSNIVDLARETEPDIILIGATRIGRVLAPRVAAALRTGLTADCTDLYIDEDGRLVQVRPAFSGNIMAEIKTWRKPQMATVRYKVMKMGEPDPSRKGEVIRRQVKIIEDTGMKILEKTPAAEMEINEARVIVSGGRGLRSPDEFRILEELAEILGGVVGSSRPLVDSGWIGREHQVGFSGNIVKPKVYIACGISGSPQHLFGMRDSEVIIAINKDPSAPIFRFSDYGVIGEVQEILPLLIEELRRGAK